MSEVDAVVFDLGGVLVDFGGVGPMRDLARIDSDDELWARWLACPWVRRFEAGGCSPGDFAAGMVSDWALAVSPEEFLDNFRSWAGAPLPGAEDLLRNTRQNVSVGCLSNTNQLHWQARAGHWDLVDLFDFRFLSFEMGAVKPDPEVFTIVCQTLDLDPSRIVFLDDNLPNVEAAAAAGLVAAHARGVDEARRVLTEARLI